MIPPGSPRSAKPLAGRKIQWRGLSTALSGTWPMPVLRTTRRIEFGDTDMAGIVHFSNFFRFMESAECEFLRQRGLSVKMLWEGRQIGFPRVSRSEERRVGK